MLKLLNDPLILQETTHPCETCTFLKMGRSPHMSQYLIHIIWNGTGYSLIFQMLKRKAWLAINTNTDSNNESLRNELQP